MTKPENDMQSEYVVTNKIKGKTRVWTFNSNHQEKLNPWRVNREGREHARASGEVFMPMKSLTPHPQAQESLEFHSQ